MIEGNLDTTDSLPFFKLKSDVLRVAHVELADYSLESYLGSNLLVLIADIGHDRSVHKLLELRRESLHSLPPAGPISGRDGEYDAKSFIGWLVVAVDVGRPLRSMVSL